MTQAAHTPGPWWPDDRADCAHMARCLIENPTWIAVEDTADDGGHIAYCAPANAHLIAAAPELLAALEALRGEAEMLRRQYGREGNTEWADRQAWLVEKADAAIAKAKGE